MVHTCEVCWSGPGGTRICLGPTEDVDPDTLRVRLLRDGEELLVLDMTAAQAGQMRDFTDAWLKSGWTGQRRPKGNRAT